MSPPGVTRILCMVEICGMLGIATFPALLPSFMTEWHLNHLQAGWISAVYYGGYLLSVPFLTGITDRVDARRILMFGVAVGGASALGFAFFARGFASALIFRLLAGIGLAGIYMPGLKLVSDHTEGPLQSRYISFYTAAFSVGASLSYLVAGEVGDRLGWRWAFGASAIGSLVAAGLIWSRVPPGRVNPQRDRIDVRPVFRQREAMAYILAYGGHTWELFSLRSWIVAFLDFSLRLQPTGAVFWSPTRIASLINLIGLPASIGGNEVSRRAGRRRTIMAIMAGGLVMGLALGVSPALPYLGVAFLAIVYGVAVIGDSASLTAGAVASAPSGFRGATLAVHSSIGFAAAFVGPLAVGAVLDGFGASPRLGWALGFLTMGLGSVAGILCLAMVGRGRGGASRSG